jgi:hypothetical protein
MHQYKNLTDHELTIPNIGLVPPGGTIQTELELNSPNLQRITNQAPAAPVPPQPVQAAPEPPKEGDK